ncbi:MAG: LysM peptidoglycan-binding domain-containing protein [Myxococcota bacterium]|nr:LysM peptidoglycan-binding domain-containing protein [Myxococcota bacterium]
MQQNRQQRYEQSTSISQGSGPSSHNYTVQPGDTLWSLANQFETSINALLSSNQLTSELIRVGQSLSIPGAVSPVSSANDGYTVRTGDSLWSIANAHGTSIRALCKANGLNRWSIIHPGDHLKLPGGGSVSIGAQNGQSASPNTSQSASHQPSDSPSAASPNVTGHNGYDSALGNALAAASRAENGGSRYSKKRCYEYVANAVDRVIGRFLYGGHAYMAASQLAARKDLFTEVPASGLSSLPAGAIVVWSQGNTESGHISISLGDGQESSDHIAPQMPSHYGGGSARVFLPKGRM